MSAKQIGGILVLVFLTALAAIIGRRMNGEALAVVTGVACGVVAGIPALVLLPVALTRREQPRAESSRCRAVEHDRPYPPVIVIQGGPPVRLPDHPPYQPPPGSPYQKAIEAPSYRVLGDE